MTAIKYFTENSLGPQGPTEKQFRNKIEREPMETSNSSGAARASLRVVAG
jgi:hypothetical protein